MWSTVGWLFSLAWAPSPPSAYLCIYVFIYLCLYPSPLCIFWRERTPWLSSPCLLLYAGPHRVQVSTLYLAGGARGPGAVQHLLAKFSSALSEPGKLSSAPPRAGNLSTRTPEASQTRHPSPPVSIYFAQLHLGSEACFGGLPPHALDGECPAPGLVGGSFGAQCMNARGLPSFA